MKKIVRCTCYVLVLLSILTACTNKDELEAKLRKDESNNAISLINDSIVNNNYDRFDLLMEKYVNDTKIYGISVSNGIYDKVQIQIAGQTKDYEWASLADDNYLPSIYYADINNDTINECIFVLTDDLGDKYISQKCHVINPETLEEIQIDDVKTYLDSNITYVENEDKIEIYLKDELLTQVDLVISENEIEADENQHEEKEIKDMINYIDLITYKVSSDELYVNVQIKYNNEIVCDTNIAYIFDADKLIVG